MELRAEQFLEQLLQTPSPSGFEQPIQQLVREYVRDFADDVRTDVHGNVYAIRYAQQRSEKAVRVMLAGHCDQIGLMVQYIDNEGFLYVQPIGGWDMQILLGQCLTVWTRQGPITGVVARRAVHLLKPEEKNKVPDFPDIWLDVGARNRAEAEEWVRIGDPVTFALGIRALRNELVAGPGLDDKVGLWVCLEALRLLRERNLQVDVYAVSTVAEEIGLRGATTAAYTVNPTVGIAVDVCHATDTPGNDRKTQGEIRCGGGPVVFRGPNIHPRVFERLEATAQRLELPIQVRGVPRATGTDANVIQISRQGVASGLIGIPNRYMHSPVEVVHRGDLVQAARLLAEFCADLTPEIDWTP
ncbi:MAG: M42 family metallopeptidase [Gemmataceae bacterium]|nr:M42 family metallopeptidase [Gemmataceae bacterium]